MEQAVLQVHLDLAVLQDLQDRVEQAALQVHLDLVVLQDHQE